ncbi:hypothetical protein [Intestinibacillus massiliensis]|uniref:hypothetical protein n=1 Tax=Intestinibacillus massiliensis TaxID=1871029 RepID=UPI001A9A5151|nr:hypothetical protein [Intestinibacillus massiliensis]
MRDFFTPPDGFHHDALYIVMPIQNVSAEIDAFQAKVTAKYPTAQIVDSGYYGVDTFTLYTLNPYVLIIQLVYADIHTNLVTIPLETNYTMPYGLIYANAPTAATKRFIVAVKELYEG